MKDLRKLLGFLIVIAIFGFNWFESILRFFAWLIMLNYAPSSISLIGDIFVRIATFSITFAVVGAIFSELRWFDRGLMRFTYFILSTLFSCLLCWVVMVFEEHIRVILVLILILIVALAIYWWYHRCRSNKE